MAKGIQHIDQAIQAAARSHGGADVAVVRQYSKPSAGDHDCGGEWWLLFVDAKLWGRRRTRSDLVSLAKRGPLALISEGQ